MHKHIVSVFLISFLILGSAVQAAPPGPSDPDKEELYYSRSWKVTPLDTKDMKGQYANIGGDPEVEGGLDDYEADFRGRGYAFCTLPSDTLVDVFSKSEKLYTNTLLPAGTRVVCDPKNGDILAVVECGNKVTRGRVPTPTLRPPPKPTHKPESRLDLDFDIPPAVTVWTPPPKPGWSKKRKVGVIGGIVVGIIFVVRALLGGEEPPPENPDRDKTGNGGIGNPPG
ncbi:MAG: hypothetical protein ABH833_04590 [Parcubacteria group bacterium]